MASTESEALSSEFGRRRSHDFELRTSSFALLFALAFLGGCATTAVRKSSIELAAEAGSKRCGCRMGIAARHLESGRSYSRNADAEFDPASIIKIAILTEAIAQVREGQVDLSERWTLTAASKAGGSGLLLLLDPGLSPTWNDLITLMIGPSDNTAANAWINRLGLENINARMEALGFHHIRLLSALPAYSPPHDQSSGWTGLRLGTVTPREVAEWLARVVQGELLDADSSRRVFAYLDNDPSRMRVARRFPSEDLWAGKTGTMSGVRHDAGVLRTKKGRFVIVILTDGGDKQAVSSADHPSVLAIADVAKTIVDTWSRELPDLAEKPR
jgi:beta-lactamase class A